MTYRVESRSQNENGVPPLQASTRYYLKNLAVKNVRLEIQAKLRTWPHLYRKSCRTHSAAHKSSSLGAEIRDRQRCSMRHQVTMNLSNRCRILLYLSLISVVNRVRVVRMQQYEKGHAVPHAVSYDSMCCTSRDHPMPRFVYCDFICCASGVSRRLFFHAPTELILLRCVFSLTSQRRYEPFQYPIVGAHV